MTLGIVVIFLVAIVSHILQSLGLTLQRKSLLTQNHGMWYFGFLLYFSTTLIGSSVILSTLPIIIVSTFGGLTLISNSFFSKLLLGEDFSKLKLLSTVLVILGSVLIDYFSFLPSFNHSLDDLLQLYQRVSFQVYFSILEFCLVFVIITTLYVHRRWSRWQGKEESVLGEADDRSPMRLYLGLAYSTVCGVLSSQCLIFAKSGIELLLVTFAEGNNQFNKPLSWLIVVILVGSGVLELYLLNNALSVCSTLIVVPVSFCSYNIASLFNGLMYYNQWHLLSPMHLVLAFFGILVVSLGVFLLSQTEKLPEEEIPFIPTSNEETVVTSQSQYGSL